MNLSTFGRQQVPLVTSQLNIRPVFDVDADVQGRDLYSTSRTSTKSLRPTSPPPRRPSM